MRNLNSLNGRIHPSTNGKAPKSRQKAAPRKPARPVPPLGEEELLLAHLGTFIKAGEDYLREFGRHHEFGHELSGFQHALKTIYSVLEAEAEDRLYER